MSDSRNLPPARFRMSARPRQAKGINLTDREVSRGCCGVKEWLLATTQTCACRKPRKSAAITLTMRGCVEGEGDQAEMALRMTQLQMKTSGGFATGDARSSAGNLQSARPWREWLEKPPLMGSSSALVESRAAG